MSPTTPVHVALQAQVSNETVRMQVPFEQGADLLSLSRDLNMWRGGSPTRD